MISYLGILSSLGLLLVCIFLIYKHSNTFTIKEQVLSHLATYPESAVIFNSTVVIVSLLRMVYFGYLFSKLATDISVVTVLICFAALLSSFLLGIIPVTLHLRFHTFLAYVLFFSSCLFLILFHFYTPLPIDFRTMLTGQIFVLCMVIAPMLLLYLGKRPGLAELTSLIFTLGWDCFVFVTLLTKFN